MSQMTFDGIPARCEYVEAEAHPHRSDHCRLACTLAPHDETVKHQLEWMPVAGTGPVERLVVIEGGLL